MHLPQCCNARHNARGYLCFNMDFAASIENTDFIAIGYTALLCVKRIDPDLLTASGFQDVDIAISGMSTRLIVEAGKLQWVLFN